MKSKIGIDMSHHSTHFTAATHGILNNNPLLGVALGAKVAYKDKTAKAVLAWGQKPSRDKAVAFACAHDLPLVSVEDGFLRSLGSGTSSVGASFIVDDVGVYFDLTAPNRLQQLIADCVATWDTDKQHHAKHLINAIITNRLSKYNATTYAPDLSALANNDKPHVIIIDQVAQDASITGAGANQDSFVAMLTHAKTCYPQANIWIKAHPAGKGHFTSDDIKAPFYLTEHCNSVVLLGQAVAVYTVSSHMGFEALMLGKRVHSFGVNWYAGFGLTQDDFIKDGPLYATVKARHDTLGIQNPSVDQLFYASYVLYSRYANPATRQACDIESLMAYLVVNRDWQDRLHGDTGQLMAYEFSRWKVPFVRQFLGFDKIILKIVPKLPLVFLLKQNIADKLNQKRDERFLLPWLGRINQYVVWGQNAKKQLSDKLATYSANTPDADHLIWCMEDGFIRSNGLGATLIAPMSVVMDDVGIYFDATAPSRLEQILNSITLDDAQKKRAQHLHELLLTKRVSKYNVLTKNHDFINQIQALKLHKKSQHRCVRLVVGQVEDDASVQQCTSLIKKNSELLAKVRADFPQDIIIYKPHPDVEAGLRTGKADNHHMADVVACHVAMPDCLDVCEVVHTISSLTGFEALLRGKQVVCYGLPFYAGFGLTQDVIEPDNTPKITALARRTRPNLPPLSLDELIFGALIAYPMYQLPDGVGLATPENVIDYLYNYQKDSQSNGTFIKQICQMIKTYFMRLRNVTISKKSP